MKKNKNSLKNLKQYQNKVRFTFYVRFRPVAQKWFFPVVGLVLLIGILKYESEKEWVFTNPKVAAVEAIRSMPESSRTGSPVADIKEDATLAKSPLTQTSGSSTSNLLSPVRASDVEVKIRKAFAHSPEVAVAIAKAESSLDPNKPSSTDVTKDGHAFSWGLFQLNLTVTNINGVACNEAFEGRNYKAIVKDKKLYEKCVKLAIDPDLNIQVAVKKYEGRGNYTAWGSFTNGAYLKHL